MKSTNIKRLSVFGFIIIGVCVGVILTSNLEWTPKGFASRNPSSVALGSQDEPSEAIIQLQNTGKAFTAVSKEVLPTVVSISTSKVIKRSRQNEQFFGPLLREWFGRDFDLDQPQEQRQEGLGSGVIVSDKGYILTNNHVIESADDIAVTLYDKRQFEAKLVGTDPLTEVAVIKIEGENLPVARLGNSEKLEVGEWVLAVGNPLHLYSTVTAGIVSAKGRDIHIIRDRSSEESSYAIEHFIQTDAAINPGNSGGALVNIQGEVIGINTAIATGTGFYAGYGFAIPINLAKKIMTDLIQQGFVTRAWVGIGMRPVTDAVAQRYNLDRPKGVLIDQVMSDSPADEAGLKQLDILLEIDGKEVQSANQVQSIIALKSPDDVIKLKILREGREKQIRVQLGQRDTGKEISSKSVDEDLPKLGLDVRNLNDELKSRLDYFKDDEGVIVVNVEQYSAAFNAGIRKQDLITQIEDDPITSLSDYRKTMKKFEQGKVVIFYIKRKTQKMHAFVKLPKK